MNPPTPPSATPRTTTLFERQDVDPQTTNQDRWEEMTDHARTLETELADQAARFHDEIVHRQKVVRDTKKLDLKELARLRAEDKRSHECIEALEQMMGKKEHETPYDAVRRLLARAERAEAALAAIARQKTHAELTQEETAEVADTADYQGAYDQMIREARAVLKP